MAKYFFVIFVFAISITKGQNISIEQIISLRTQSLASVEEYLTAKKWEMIEAKEGEDDKMGYVGFAYNKSAIDDKAESFITFYYDKSSAIYNRLSIQVNKVETYNVYITRLKKLGFKLQSSTIEEGSIIKIYKSGNNTIKITTSTQEVYSSTKTTYSFFICNSLDYSLQFEN